MSGLPTGALPPPSSSLLPSIILFFLLIGSSIPLQANAPPPHVSADHLIRHIFSVFFWQRNPFWGWSVPGCEDSAWEVGEGYRHTGTIITSAVGQTAAHPETGSQALTHL